MVKLFITFRYIALILACFLLSACLGGTIAQQIASAITTRIADKAVSSAIDAKEKRDSEAWQNAPLDRYTVAFVNSAFDEVKPIAEPLPEKTVALENPIQIIQTSQLVRVELFNLIIGEEKNAVYEKARIMGATSLPQKREWQNWNVATGNIKTENDQEKKMITFLIPPEFGKLPSGSEAMVELASPGELNIARYKAN